ncbi:MAG: 1-phosphofructokinase family hexose kinase [Christensenellales bacterium]|jgi:1-phosphofructokinase
MITAISLNPCIDRTVKIPSFQYGGMNRICDVRMEASGKGVNVALGCAALGVEKVACIGFNCQGNGKIVCDRLKDAGVRMEFVYQGGDVRINTKVLDLSKNVVTELNEAGRAPSAEEMAQMEALVLRYAPKSSQMVFTGSLPPSCDPATYRDLIRQASAMGVLCILDAEGEKLRLGVQAQPYLIKPNRYELELAVGEQLKTLADVKRAALSYIDQGVRIVAVSMGGDGALITDGSHTYFAPPIPVELGSTVGAGDSMVSGFCAAIDEGLDTLGLFRYGVASATAAVMAEGTQLVTRQGMDPLLARVAVQEV